MIQNSPLLRWQWFIINERPFLAVQVEHANGVGSMLHQTMSFAHRPALWPDLAFAISTDHIKTFANVGMHASIGSFTDDQSHHER